MTLLLTDNRAAALIALAMNPDTLPPDANAPIRQMISDAAKEAWFRTYEQSRDSLSLKEGNAIASVVLNAHTMNSDPQLALADNNLLARGDAWYCAREAAQELIARYDDDLQDLTRRDHSNLLRTLTERIEAILIDTDPSLPRDALSSCDRAEVLFIFSPKWKHALDASIYSNRPWPEFSELGVNDDLAHALACLGYTVGEYRKASKNRHATDRPRGTSRLARPAVARRATPLCNWKAIEEMVDNACSTHFLFCLYAIVSIDSLIDLDLSKELTFSKAAVATWNPWSGTFHDAVSVTSATVTPSMGTLLAPDKWYSPDEICGFVHRYYEADLTNS